MIGPLPVPDHSTPELAGPNMPVHVEQEGQSVFNVKVYDKVTNSILDVVYRDDTSLHPGKYLFGIMINRVMALLTTLVKTMQGVAVLQSDKLAFFTKMQQANTAQMNSVHTFVINNRDAYVSVKGDGQNSTESLARQALNQTNSAYIQQIQANNNMIANSAKQQQTNINQTQEAVTACSNQLTSILQQLRSINSAVSQAK